MFERAGIMHYKRGRSPAFVFDMMEPEQPKVDRTMLDYVKGYVFNPADLVIRSDGVCRLKSANGANGRDESFNVQSLPPDRPGSVLIGHSRS